MSDAEISKLIDYTMEMFCRPFSEEQSSQVEPTLKRLEAICVKHGGMRLERIRQKESNQHVSWYIVGHTVVRNHWDGYYRKGRMETTVTSQKGSENVALIRELKEVYTPKQP